MSSSTQHSGLPFTSFHLPLVKGKKATVNKAVPSDICHECKQPSSPSGQVCMGQASWALCPGHPGMEQC